MRPAARTLLNLDWSDRARFTDAVPRSPATPPASASPRGALARPSPLASRSRLRLRHSDVGDGTPLSSEEDLIPNLMAPHLPLAEACRVTRSTAGETV